MIDVTFAQSQRLRALWWWLPLYLVVALGATLLVPPMPLHSTRALAVAWDMWAHHQFWVPHLNGAPYAQKAPLLFWLIQAGWAVFGVNAVWPRVLMVSIGAVQLILAWALARRLFPDREWVARAVPWLLLALSYGFLFDLQIMYDSLLSVWVLAAMLCLVPGTRRTSPRWIGVAVAIGLGLLTKGPVMLVHTTPVWLLGPWWCGYAREHRVRWYGFGFAAIVGGGLMLAAWVVPALQLTGPAYAHNLLFRQTAGRVTAAFIHQRPLWWYLPWLPVLLYPFVVWPRMWAGIGALWRPLEPGMRMLLAWLVPAFVIFSAFSGKQTYYLVPELPTAAMVMAVAVGLLRQRGGKAARSAWLGTWPLALCAFALAALLFALPPLVHTGHVHSHWLHDFAGVGVSFAVLYLLLGVFVLLPVCSELCRIACAGLIGTAAVYVMFTLAVHPAFDMRPASQLLAHAQSHGRAIGNLADYDGQFAFAGRMTQPVLRVRPGEELQAFARQHPHGLVVAYPGQLAPVDLRHARLVQPFRGAWMVIWDASVLAALRRGGQLPAALVPTILLPSADYWRYANVR